MEYRLRFAVLKQKWAVGQTHAAVSLLDSLIRSLVPSSGHGLSSSPSLSSSRYTADAQTHHDCLLKLSEWKVQMCDPGEAVDGATRREVLALHARATLILPQVRL